MKRTRKIKMGKQAVQDYIQSSTNQAMYKMLFWIGFILFFVSLLSLGGCYKYHVVERDGVPVKMRILKHYISSGKGVNYSTGFFYNGEEFLEKTNKQFCDNYPVGNLVTMKYVPGINIVLFPDENTDWIFQILGGMAFLGLGLIMYYFIKSKRI